jgi:hypothetical protein
MKRVILSLLALCLPMTAAAQGTTPGAAAEGVVVPTAQTTAAGGSGVVQPGSASGTTRRRPSMVGYVNDATIENRIRVRFDAATGLNAADRAEFFYAKCGCYRDLAGDPAYDPNAPGPGPGVLTLADFQQFYAWGEYAVNGRLSLVGELPIRALRPQAFLPGTGSFGNSTGLSDVRAGVKLGLASDSNSQITLQVLAQAPSGDSRKGLGTNRWSVEPAVLYWTQLGSRVGLEAQFGTVFPLDGSAGVPVSGSDKFSGRVIYYGIGPSFDLVTRGSLRFAPVFELVGWHVVDGFSTAEGGPIDGINIVNAKFGGRLMVDERNSLYIGYGHALTNAVWYDDVLRFEYRVGF